MAKSFIKKIIVAVNGKTSSIHTAMYAIMMAKTYNIEIKFVYVVDTATIKFLSMNKFFISDESKSYEERLKTDGEHYLSYVAMLASSKGLKSHTELRSGGVFTEILKAADDFGADLILLGGTDKDVGKGGIKKNMLSPDQSEILANSKCPVLIVQKPNIEAEFKIF